MRRLLYWFWWMIAGVLIVLLVFSSWTRTLVNAPVRLVGEYVVGPLYRLFAQPTLSHDAYDQEKLRDALRVFLGDTYTTRDIQTREQQAADISTWATERALPAPVLATIITQYEEAGQRQFVVDRGTDDGVQEGSAVVLGKGVLVGRIVRVSSSRSIIRLLTARDHAFSVRLDGLEQAAGLLKGQGEEESPTVEFVPRERTIALRDVVITSGLDSGVPAGLLTGVVEEIRASEGGPWQTLLVTPFIRPGDIRTVGILSYVPSF